MNHLLVLMDVSSKEWTDLTATLEARGYRIVATESHEELIVLIGKREHAMALIDLDSHPTE